MTFATKGVVERLEAALEMAARRMPADFREKIYREAIEKEIDTIKAIKDMPGFRAWFEGERFDLTKVKARK